jgi:nitroreductase
MPAELATIFEAARWAASARNEQPWRFIVGLRNSLTYKKILNTMMDFSRPWASTAPVLILGLAKTKYEANGAENPYHLYDLGAAATTITLQATAQGLATRTMASFDHEAARKAFGIPEDYAIGTVIVLGYQGEPAALGNEQMIAMETAPRGRKPLNELIFSAWEAPIELA